MAEYYLISQLPSLDAIGENTPMPITQEQFFELCNRFLNKKAVAEIENLTLAPSLEQEKTASKLIDAWNIGEKNLRIALAKVRAEKMNKSFDVNNNTPSLEICKMVSAAIELKNPLEAEKFLLNYRLSFLETLRPGDMFSKEYLYYYALKLKLISRIREFDAVIGESTYKNIYNSILDGDRLEAKYE